MLRKFALVIVLMFAIFTVGCGGDDEASSQSIEEWINAEVTKESVETALSGNAPVNPISKDSGFPKSITEINVVDNVDGNKNIMVYYKSGSVWDETDFVKRAGGTAILVASILFENPNIDTVGIFAATDMTDQYGNTKSETVIKITTNREIADKVDWEGIADRHVTDPGNIYRIAEDYSIHPGILKNVKLDEMKLV